MNGLVLDDASRVYVGESFKGHTMALFFLFHPGQQSLFDDPASGAFHAFGEAVNLLGERGGYVCGQDAGFCVLD